MSDKKFTPQEAAVLVLKKAEELYKSSSLAKGDWAKIHSKLKREGYSEKSADKIDGAIKAKMNKSDAEGHNPDAQADAKLGEQVEQDVKQHEESNSDPAHAEPQMKGHIKLAKFVGRMEHKKGLAKAEVDSGKSPEVKLADRAARNSAAGIGGMSQTVEPKGVHPGRRGDSLAGHMNATGQKEAAVSQHKQVLDQIHQMSKPKLPG